MIRRISYSATLLAGASLLASAADFQGVLVDWNCVKPMIKNGREAVLKQNPNCSLIRNVNRPAYGLITDEKKFYRLDDPGNRRVLELLRNTADKDNLKVVVTGDVTGNTIKVTNITIL